MIAIVDYGMGNLGSVAKAFRRLGRDAVVTDDVSVIRGSRAIVVPGVGAFDRCVRNLRRKNLDGVIREALENGTPYLGICLGYQILFEGSEEGGSSPGLGIVPGTVKRFTRERKVPHMGWNTVAVRQREPLFAGIPDGSYFYFVHSFFPQPVSGGIVASTTEYGETFASAIRSGRIFATQFHPEKSQRLGLALLKNFATFVEEQC